MSEGQLIDYQDYVEMVCIESIGGWRNIPSRHDARRSAQRFLEPSDRPKSPRALTDDEYFILTARAFQFQRYRLAAFGTSDHLHKCPYCSVALVEQTLPSEHTAIVDCHYGLCLSCGWWETEQTLHSEADERRSIHRRALLLEFSLSGIDAPVDALSRYLAKHPDDLVRISPRKLEELTAHVFRDFMDCDVTYVGGPGDGGIDLLLIQGAARFAIQVKRRVSRAKAEPVSSIREFVGALVLSSIPRGIFVTSAPRFSKPAIAAGRRAVHLGAAEYIELADASKLIQLCRSVVERNKDQNRFFSKSDDLLDHVNIDHDEYISIAVEDPGWHVASGTPLRSKESNERAQRIMFDEEYPSGLEPPSKK